MKECIETERLILRSIKMTDAEDFFEYAKDEDTGPRAGWPPHKTIEESIQILEKWLKPGYKEKVFAVIYKLDNKMIGTFGIEPNSKNEKNEYAYDLMKQGKKLYEVGNVISKKYWGQGISSEGLRAVIDYIFEESDADVVMTTHAEMNKASGRVQEKCGMKVVSEFESDQAWCDTGNAHYIARIKTREDWQQEKQLLKK